MKRPLLVSCTWLFAACGTAHGALTTQATDASTDPPVAEADYTATRAAAETEQVDRCCQQVGAVSVADDYTAKTEEGLQLYAPLPDSGASYDEKAASACIAQLRQAKCTSSKAERTLDKSAPCANVYKYGQRKLGQACRSFYDCAQDAGVGTLYVNCVTISSSPRAAVCVRVTDAGVGQPCATSSAPNTSVQCKGTLLCNDQTRKCERRAARGEPCLTGAVWGDTCADGSVCDRLGTKRCVAPTPVGDACKGPAELCEGLACFGGTCREPVFETTSGFSCKW